MSSVPATSSSETQPERDSVRQLGVATKYPPGFDLCCQGDRAENVYLIEKGLVVLSHVDHNGHQYCLTYHTTNWIIGVTGVLLNRLVLNTVTTRLPSCVRIIPGPAFLRELKSNEKLSNDVHRMLAWELEEQHEKATALALRSVRERLERFLWGLLCELPKVNGKLQIPFSAAEMAQFVASSPQHLSAVFGELEAEGIVKRSRGWLVVEDRSRLWHWEGI